MLVQPTTEAGQAGLAALRARPADAVVAVDYDGVLAPVVARPQDAVPAAGAVAALTALALVVRQVALVTGRNAQVVVDLAGLADVPGLVVLGQYGAQRWAGTLSSSPPAPGLDPVRATLPRLLAEHGVGDARIEDKGLSLVVHTRGLADPDGALRQLAAPVRDLVTAHGLQVHPGRLVLEIRPPGFDKRGALLSLCQPPPSAVLFAGDDVGDLPAFDAIAELRAAGVPGLTVCSASAEGPRELRERADVVVHGPAGVVRLLAGLLAP